MEKPKIRKRSITLTPSEADTLERFLKHSLERSYPRLLKMNGEKILKKLAEAASAAR